MDKIKKFFSSSPTWVVFCAMIFPLIIGELIPFGTSLFFCIMFGWIFLLGIVLQNKVEAFLKKSTTLLKICFSLSVIYIIFLETVWEFNPPSYFLVFHMVVMFCIVYQVYFVARSLVVAEARQLLDFDRYIGTMLLIWFFPIGIWFVHPRIRNVLQ
ncbi:MAG: hypothetical protein KKG47_08770 [Proteobacteria bacterium]|nr:hypothetical protein [Pseudomonadota bacterium]MBU1736742.1 hypothetical protein [Pseudomonadota bacterium]